MSCLYFFAGESLEEDPELLLGQMNSTVSDLKVLSNQGELDLVPSGDESNRLAYLAKAAYMKFGDIGYTCPQGALLKDDKFCGKLIYGSLFLLEIYHIYWVTLLKKNYHQFFNIYKMRIIIL